MINKSIFLTVVSPDFPAHIKVDRRINFLENNDMVKLYSNSDIFINPSLYENVSTVLLEAMSAGTIILTKQIGYLPSIIPYQDYQIYSSYEDIVTCLLKICSSQENLLEKIRKHNRKFVINQF